MTPTKIDYLPKGTVARPGYKLDPKFITIHNTGVIASARDSSSFFKRQAANSYTSVHFFVDDKEVIQMLPLNEVSWHAGDGVNGRGNRESISIEICEVSNQEQANKNAIELCRKLLKEYPRIPIVPHRYWINKNCPRLLLPVWYSFLGEIYSK